jgi:hypothetical protein
VGTGIGHDVTIGRYLTPEAMRLGLFGLAAGTAVGLTWRLAGRARWGAAPFLLAVLVSARLTGRSDWPNWDATTAAGAFVTLLAGVGAGRLLCGQLALGWGWVAAAALISAVGVWAGVPETGPSLLAGGVVIGLSATAALTRARWAPMAGVGVAAIVGWAALSGAAGQGWATIGGAMCSGMAPWFALAPTLSTSCRCRSRKPGLWLLCAHSVLVLVAARWIGVAPDAGWGRVAVVAMAGCAVAVATGRLA